MSTEMRIVFEGDLGNLESTGNRAKGVIKSIGDEAESSSKRGGGLTGTLGKMSEIAGGFVLGHGIMALPGILQDTISGASDVNESLSKVVTLLGPESAGPVEKWADGMYRLGQSKAEALDALGGFANMLETIGMSPFDAGEMSMQITELASDFASFHNANPAEVIDAMSAALRGEAEPMSRYGILMNDATLKTEAMKLGLISTTKDALTPQQKTLAAYNLILEQAGAAQGDFERTSGGLANRQRILAAEFANVKAKLGQELLPAALSVAEGLLALVPVAEVVGGAIGDGFALAFPYIQQGAAILADLAQTYGPPVIEFARELGGEALSAAADLWQNVLGPALERGRDIFEDLAPKGLELAQMAYDLGSAFAENLGGAVLEEVADLWETKLSPAFTTARDIFQDLAPKAADLAVAAADIGTAFAEKLQAPVEAVLGFVADHKEEFAVFGAAMLVAVPIVYSLAAAHTAEAAAATAAAVAEGAALLPVLAISAAIGVLALGVFELIKHWDDITAKYPIVGAAADALQAKFTAAAQWITGTGVPAVVGFAEAFTGAVGGAIGFVVDHWGEIQGVIQPGLEALGIIISAQVDAWVLVFQTAFGIIQGALDVFIGIFTGDWQQAWAGVQQIFGAAWDGITGAFQLALDTLIALAKTIGPSILEGVGDLGGLLFDAGQDIINGLIEGVKSMAGNAIDSVKGLAGDMVGAAKDKLKIWSPSREFVDIGIQIPAGLAEGINAGKPGALDALRTWINDLNSEARDAWWMQNAGWANVLRDAGFFVNEDGSISIGGPNGGGVSEGFTGWLRQHGIEAGNWANNLKANPNETNIEDALSGTGGWAGGAIPEEAGTMYGLYRAGIIDEDTMLAWLHDHGYTDQWNNAGTFGAPPVTKPAASSGSGLSSANASGGSLLGVGSGAPAPAPADVPKLANLLRTMTPDARRMWWNDPKNGDAVKALTDAGYRLDSNGALLDPASTSPTGTDRSGGPTSSAAGPTSAAVGGSGGRGAGGSGGGAGGAMSADVADAILNSSRKLEQILDVQMKILDILRVPVQPQIIIRAETGDPEGLARELVEPMDELLNQLHRRQASFGGGV